MVITNLDRVNVPQSAGEGATEATWGVSPSFGYLAHLHNASLEENTSEETLKLRVGGKEDVQRTDRVGETVSVKLKGYLTKAATDKNLLSWAMSPLAGAGTAIESRTFFDSYKDANGNTIYKIYKGCMPSDITITTDRSDYDRVELNMVCKEIVESAVSPISGDDGEGNPYVPAVELADVPLTHVDQGDGEADGFQWDGTKQKQNAFAITVSHEFATDDSSGSIGITYREPTQRTINGSVTLFKQSDIIQKAARAQTQKTASFKISDTITLGTTSIRFMPSSETEEGNTSNATMENKTWEANDLTIL